MFLISFYITAQLRSNFFNKQDSHEKLVPLSNTFKEIKHLSINRWVGIDGLLAVSQSDKLNFTFFLSAWKEKKKIRSNSFYIKNFFSKFSYPDKTQENLNIVITPGLIAFLSYSGSILFVFFSVFFLVLICIYIENLFYVFSGFNIVLSNIIGYALAYRLIHFGYIPSNIINFLFSFFVTLLIVYLISRLIWKKK